MATIVLNMGVAEWGRYMQRLGPRFMPAVLRGVRSGAQRCVGIMQTRTDLAIPASDHGTAGAVDTGLYKAAWQSAPLSNGAQVFNSRPYSAVIDFGRRAAVVGRAGITNLEQWAKRKLHLSGNEATSAAFAIAKTLEKRPLRAREVMTGGLDDMTKAVMSDVRVEVDRELWRK